MINFQEPSSILSANHKRPHVFMKNPVKLVFTAYVEKQASLP